MGKDANKNGKRGEFSWDDMCLKNEEGSKGKGYFVKWAFVFYYHFF